MGAERGSFYIIDTESDDLAADAFEQGIDESAEDRFHKKNLKIKLTNQDSGIPGYVARTGEVVNIVDAYHDPRFNKEQDEKSGSITRSVLCMPILSVNGLLGIISPLVNLLL